MIRRNNAGSKQSWTVAGVDDGGSRPTRCAAAVENQIDVGSEEMLHCARIGHRRFRRAIGTRSGERTGVGQESLKDRQR